MSSMETKLKFSRGNAKLDNLETKLGKQVWTFSTLAGVACPYAKLCKSQAVETPNGLRIQDGPDTVFRCFSASQEVLFKSVYRQRKHNLDLLKTCANDAQKMSDLILASLPKKAGVIRIHVSGDFFTQAYFDAWLLVAKKRSDILFYAYTKSLPFWVKRADRIPSNLILTASYGGQRDELIDKHNLRSAIVVEDESKAIELGLPIDHDDSLAASNGGNFALLLHGPQPKGKAKAKYGYKRK